MAQVFDYKVGELNVPLHARYLVSGLPVTGLTIRVQVRDTKTGYYLDFADNTFKSSGWTQKQQTLPDIGNGQYQYLWNASLSVIDSAIIAAEYEVVDLDYAAETTDFLLFGTSALDPSDVAREVWRRQTSMDSAYPGSYGVLVVGTDENVAIIKGIETGRWKIENNQLILYKGDNVTEVARFNLFDSTGQPTEDQVFDRVKV
jgi:hypothetical protein